MRFLRKNRFLLFGLMAVFSFNSVGFAFDAHFCEGELQSISFFGEAEQCEMGKKKIVKPCCIKRQQKNGFHKKGCCHNELVYLNTLEDFEGADNTSFTKEVQDSKNQVTVASRVNLYFSLARVSQFYLDLPPPFLRKPDLSVLQVFRI